MLRSRLLEEARKSGCTPCNGGLAVSPFECAAQSWQQRITVAWLYPPSKSDMGWMRTKDFSFGTAHTSTTTIRRLAEELQNLLERWIDQFSSDGFAEDVSSKGVKAWAVGYDAASHHVDLLVERLTKVLSELKSL